MVPIFHFILVCVYSIFSNTSNHQKNQSFSHYYLNSTHQQMEQSAFAHFLPYFLAICAFCLYIIVNILLKIISKDFGIPFGIYGMNAGALLVQLAYFHFFGKGINLDVKNPMAFRYLCYRTAFSTCSIMILLYNVSTIPVSMANTFHNLGPLFIYFVDAAYYHVRMTAKYRKRFNMNIWGSLLCLLWESL